MSDNNEQDAAKVRVETLVISLTSDGQLNLKAPDSFLVCLGMLEWANEHLWEAYKQRRAQQKAGPKIQLPGMRIPPPAQN